MDNRWDNTTLLARLETLETERSRLIRRARVLERQRSKVEIAIAATTRELDLWRRGFDGDADATDQRFVANDYASVEIVKSTVAEACDYILRRANRALTVHQLLEVFEDSGRDVSGANAHRIVYSTLRRHRGQFARVAAGRFALAHARTSFDEPDEMTANLEPELTEQFAGG